VGLHQFHKGLAQQGLAAKGHRPCSPRQQTLARASGALLQDDADGPTVGVHALERAGLSQYLQRGQRRGDGPMPEEVRRWLYG
jgi:hypothetical protein